MSDGRWFYVESGARKGPVALSELADLLATGRVPEDTLIWAEGKETWVRARDVPELTAKLPPPLPLTSAPSTPPPAPTAPPARTSARVPFKGIHGRTQIVIGILTLLSVYGKNSRQLDEAFRGGPGITLVSAAVGFGLDVIWTSVLSSLVLGLPIAGLIYFVRNIGKEPEQAAPTTTSWETPGWVKWPARAFVALTALGMLFVLAVAQRPGVRTSLATPGPQAVPSALLPPMYRRAPAPSPAERADTAIDGAPLLQFDGTWEGREDESSGTRLIKVTFEQGSGHVTYYGAPSVVLRVHGIERGLRTVRFHVQTSGGTRHYHGRWDGRRIVGIISSDAGRSMPLGTFEVALLR
jgi:hypothetical protein